MGLGVSNALKTTISTPNDMARLVIVRGYE